MSHFIRIKTELRERALVIGALRDLGIEVEEGSDLPVHGDGRETVTAEILAKTGCGYPIGLRQTPDGYEVVADWYHVEMLTDWRRVKFLEDLKQRYAYRVVVEQARAQNLVVEEERQENGDIIVVLSERS